MQKALWVAIFLCWSGIASADFFVWKDGQYIVTGIGKDQTDAWRNVSASSLSGWSEDRLKNLTLIEACRAPGWYAVFDLHDANVKRSITKGICGSATRDQARQEALRSCKSEPECNSLLNGTQTWINENFGFDSGSWMPPSASGSFYFLHIPGEKSGNYRCAGNDPNNKGRNANPECFLTSVSNEDLPKKKTRGQIAAGQ